MDASVLLAAAAFVTSVASLYLTSLRRARIVWDHLPEGDQFEPWSWSQAIPERPYVAAAVFVSNAGAHSSVLEKWDLEDFRCVGRGPALFNAASYAALRKQPTPHMNPSTPPWPVDANDGHSYYATAALQTADDVNDSTTYARRLRDLEGLQLTMRWSYRRARVMPWGDSRRTTKTKTFTVSAAKLRSLVRTHWAANGWTELVDELGDG